MSNLVVTDVSGEKYEFKSVGCVDQDNLFWEVYVHPHEYAILWSHEEELPTSYEELMERCDAFLDWRGGQLIVEKKNDALEDVTINAAVDLE